MKFQIKTFLILLYINCYVKFTIQKPTQHYWYETRPGYKWAFAHSYSWAVIPKDGVSNGNAHSSGISMTGTQDGVHSSQQPMNNYPINGQQNVPLYGMDGQNQQQYQQQGQNLNELQLKAYIQNLLQQQQLRSQSQSQSTQSQFPYSQPLSVPPVPTYQSQLTQPQTQPQLQIPLSMSPPQIPFSSQLSVSQPQLPMPQPQSLSPQPQPFAQPHSLPQPQSLPLPHPQYLPQPQPLPLSNPQPLPFQPQSLPLPQPHSLPSPQAQSLPIQPQSLPLPVPQSLPLPQPQSLPVPQPQSLPVPQPQSLPLPQPQSADLENYIRKMILDMQSQSTINNDAVNVPKYNVQNLSGSNSNLQNQQLTDEQLQRIINKILTGLNYDSSTNSVQNQNSDLQHQLRAQQYQQPQNVPVNYYQQPISSNYNGNPYTSPVSNTGLNQQYPLLGKQPTTTIDCSNCPLANSGPIAIASSISLANISPQHLISDPLKLLGASSMTYTRV